MIVIFKKIADLVFEEMRILKKSLLICLFFCSPSGADWISLTENIPTHGDVYWYKKKQIRVLGGEVYVWNRVRYKKLEDGVGSYQVYNKINCDEYSYQWLSVTYYLDFNWTKPLVGKVNMIEKKFIESESPFEILADIVCNKVDSGSINN